jgi:acetyl-CoA C-acetyltransferase
VGTAADLAPNTPVIVGIGFHQEKFEDPTASAEPSQLMVEAVRAAAADAGSPALVGALESISVPQGMWEYRNPGKMIAAALGCPGAKSILAGLGVLQLQLISDLCDAIAAGERHLGVVVAGEAKYRRLRSTITGQPVADTQPDGLPPPDLHQTSTDMWCSDLESRRGLTSPVEFFAIIESALRYARGLDVERHRDELAALYSRFSAIAAANPHAWRRDPVSAADIRNASPKNPMLAFPYTKRHASQWNVNQAVAILVCSAERARALGLLDARWIYPLAAVHSKHVVAPAQMRELHSRLGTVVVGERALALAGVTPRDLTAAELYSCFPAAIQSFAKDLRIPEACPWTVSGSMAFFGGPFNNASIEGAAAMVEFLRSDGNGGASSGRRVGLVSNLSGIFSKQACTVLANTPSSTGYRFEDVTAEVAAANPPVPIREDYVGPATIVGYTVVFQGGEPSHAIAYCDTPDGGRTVVRSAESALLTAMMAQEHCGRTILVGPNGSVQGQASRQ